MPDCTKIAEDPKLGLFRNFDAIRHQNNVGFNCFNIGGRWHFPRAIRNLSSRTLTF
jgi:hypothetical protein